MAATSTDRHKAWLLGIVFLGAAIIAIAVSVSYKADPTEVRVTSATYQDLDRSVSTIGKVVPVNEFQARANFSGMVEKVYVQLGEKVHPGQLLIKMKDPFASSRVLAATVALQSTQVGKQNVQQSGSQEDHIFFAGDRKHAELDQAAAANALATLKQLERSGAASEAEVFAGTQRLEAANATLQTVRERSTNRYSAKDIASWTSRVAQAKSSLDAEKISFANANITSPISGTVYLTPIFAYDFVSTGADLLHVADLNHLQIRAYFDEPDIGKLLVGQAVKITWDGKPDKSWHGHIQHAPLAAMVSGSRNVGECIIAIDDAKGDLMPNTNVSVAVSVQQRANVLTLPREALHTDGPANFVYRVVGTRLLRTPVDVGIVNLSRVEITRGLTPNDIIALHATDNTDLTENLKVRTSR